MTNDERPQGLAKADQALSGGGGRGRWPTLQLKPSDRARFHCLTSGSDPYFEVSQFHEFGEWGDPNRRVMVCVRSMTIGEESCRFCDEGHSNTNNQFALWVYTHFILHSFDNPDQQAASWPTARVRIGKDGQGQDIVRNMFKEEIGKPQVLWLKAARDKKWLVPFSSRWTAFGTLMNHQFELLREGEQIDTEYYLNEVKAEPVPKALLDEHLPNLVPIADIFRSTLGFVPSAATQGLGQDSLQATALPAIEDVEGAVVPAVPDDAPELL